MARPRIDTPERLIASRTARGESAATIRAALGPKSPSASTLKRRQRELRGKATARPSPPKRIAAPVPDVPVPDDRARLLHEYAHAEGAEAYPLALALARLERSDFARWVGEGQRVPASLSSDDPISADLYGTPEGLAHLAARARGADWRAAVALLKSALEIVKGDDYEPAETRPEN